MFPGEGQRGVDGIISASSDVQRVDAASQKSHITASYDPRGKYELWIQKLRCLRRPATYFRVYKSHLCEAVRDPGS